jgi:hypothetical protein
VNVRLQRMSGELQYDYQQGSRLTIRTPETIGDLDLSVLDMKPEYPCGLLLSLTHGHRYRTILCAVGHCDCMKFCLNGAL